MKTARENVTNAMDAFSKSFVVRELVDLKKEYPQDTLESNLMRFTDIASALATPQAESERMANMHTVHLRSETQAKASSKRKRGD